MDDGIFWISVEEFKKSMLYLVVSYYHPGWWHNYIPVKGDDGLLHTFLFDIKPGQEGLTHLILDHYD